MLKGYNGKILRLDLSTGDMDYEFPDEQTARKYIGGVGLAAKIPHPKLTHYRPRVS
jgi:aldehyde:ferredoxin oxidoreductase